MTEHINKAKSMRLSLDNNIDNNRQKNINKHKIDINKPLQTNRRSTTA